MTIATPTMPKPAWMTSAQPAVSLGLPKSILIYGSHGTRKTSIASTIFAVPGISRVLHIDIDAGTEALATDPFGLGLMDKKDAKGNVIEKGAISRGEYFVRSITRANSRDVNTAKRQIDTIINDITSVDLGFDAVIFDTLDIAQDAAERNIKANNADSKNTFAVYGELGQWTMDTVSALHDTPNFVSIILAHQKEVSEDDGSKRILPTLSGSSKDAIGGIPSIVAHFGWQPNPETEELGLVATLGPSAKYISKNRFGLPDQVLMRDLPTIYQMIEANINKPATAAASK